MYMSGVRMILVDHSLKLEGLGGPDLGIIKHFVGIGISSTHKIISNYSRPSRGSYAAFNTKSSSSIPPIQEDAVKKFGSAKAISSDMYFGNQDVRNAISCK